MSLLIAFFILTVFLVAIMVLVNWNHSRHLIETSKRHERNLLELAQHAIVSQHATSAVDAADAGTVLSNSETLVEEAERVQREIDAWNSKDNVVGFKADNNGREVEVDFLTHPTDGMLEGAAKAALIFKKEK